MLSEKLFDTVITIMGAQFALIFNYLQLLKVTPEMVNRAFFNLNGSNFVSNVVCI